MEKKSKKSIVIGITSLLLVTLTLLGLTYAYYRTRIIGNNADKSISVTSKLLELTYHDGNASFSTGSQNVLVEPGFMYTKTFSVENTGDEAANYTIVLDNVANTFKRTGDWTYTLTNTTTSESLTGIINKLSEQTLLGNISIAAEATDNYKLVVTYENLENVDQSEDMGKLMSFRVNIKDVSEWDSAIEGTLLYALRENNEVVEPLTVPGKAPSGVTFTEGTLGTTTSNIVVNTEEQEHYIVYGTGYEYDNESGTYSLTGVKVGKYSECYNEIVDKYVAHFDLEFEHTLTVTGAKVERTSGLNVIYQVTATTIDSITYKTKIKATSATISEAVLSSTEDDYGTSYYFRGDVENNYVTYANMCWRIVRVQGDGTIKLVLADRDNFCGPNTNDITTEEIYNPMLGYSEKVNVYNGYSTLDGGSAFIADPMLQHFTYKYNTLNDESDFIFEDSDIPKVLNAWVNGGTYKYLDCDTYEEIDATFTQKISDEDQKKLTITNWCNDTSITNISYSGNSEEGNQVFDESLAAPGEWYKYVDYGAYGRLGNRMTAKPSLKCDLTGLNNSKAIKNSSNIGILTADEVAFAGGASIMHDSYYLNTNATQISYYTMSPLSSGEFYDVYSVNYDYDTLTTTALYSSEVIGGEVSIRPAVVLRSDVTIVSGGNGTQSNPYVIS